jgi:DNA-binding transcriptional MerR regulator
VGTLAVSELSARTGVPVSTIHHYRRLGLLPPPIVVDRRRLRYGDEHIRALRLIRRLRERRGLPLNRIAAILPTLLASEQEAFRPAMWDRLLDARASPDPTLAALLDVAVAEFSARPFDAVTVAELAVAAGVGKHTFYRYFDSKEAAFVAAASAATERVVAAVETTRHDDDIRAALAGALGPVLPLLLELATRASRDAAAFGATAANAFASIVAALEPRSGSPNEAMAMLTDVASDLVLASFVTIR